MTTDVAAKKHRKNPYIGPRAFKTDERLYGRERECRELTDLLIAERIVLIHSPSGAGKTSLILSRVVPELEREGFTVSPILRVNAVPPNEVANRWVYSVALALVGEDRLGDWPGLEHMAIPEVLKRLDSEEADTPERVLLFDQFEEILRYEPCDREGQKEFFRQLGVALTDTSRFALFSIREDFVGGVDPYRHYLPGQLRKWYRLDFLTKDAALRAIQKPAEEYGAEFSDEGAEQLFDDLATVDFEVLGGEPEKRVGPHVEPVHLQVACHQLWRALKKRRSGEVGTITAEDVEEFADIDTTLARFYSDAVTDVVAETHVDERKLRDWFARELITSERSRRQTRRGPNDGVVDVNAVLTALEDRYLIRSDQRAGVIWYELTHDRLVTPVLQSNKDWRRTNLHWVQYRAYEWDRKGRNDIYLLQGDILTEAQVWLKMPHRDVRDLEREFVNVSRERNGQTLMLRRLNLLSKLAVLLAVIVILELAVIIWVAS